MTTLIELEKLRAEITVLEQRLAQLEEPAPSPDLSGLGAGEVMAKIQSANESERARQQQRQDLLLALPVLRQRFGEMEKEVAQIKAELDKKMVSYRKLASKLSSSLDGVLLAIDELKAIATEVQAVHRAAYGVEAARMSPVWIDNWSGLGREMEFPAIALLPDEQAGIFRVILTTRALLPSYQPRT